MKISIKQKFQRALERLKQGAGAIAQWAREYHIRRLQRAIARKECAQ